MVIKALINAWRSGVQMRHMYDELMAMLQATESMFVTIGRVLFEGVDPKAVAQDIYDTDIRVNKTERKIRREIVEHLAIRPGGDVPACLVLMSVIKDAERIGDYCKNLFEIRDMLGGPVTGEEMARQSREAYDRVLQAFRETQKALREGDADLAAGIMRQEKQMAHALDEKVRAVAESDMPARRAVCQALSFRHMKRVHAHLCNIASSLVQPVHKIDYFGKTALETNET